MNDDQTISLDKTYKTRDGLEVKLWWIGPGLYGPRSVFGAFQHADKSWASGTWREEDGRASSSYVHSTDLVEVKPRYKRKVWMNIYRDGDGGFDGGIYFSRKDADNRAAAYRTACLEREIDFEDGEGL